eukprot:gene17220-biopygen14822
MGPWARNLGKDDSDQHVDNHAEQYVQFLTTHAVPKAMTLDEIQTETKLDKTLQQIRTNTIRTNNWKYLAKKPADLDEEISFRELQLFAQIQDELTVDDDNSIILRGSRIVLPSKLRSKAIHIAHERHQGLVNTKQLLREKVWFPGIDNMTKQALEHCLPCQASGPKSRPEPLKITVLPPEPWHTVKGNVQG